MLMHTHSRSAQTTFFSPCNGKKESSGTRFLSSIVICLFLLSPLSTTVAYTHPATMTSPSKRTITGSPPSTMYKENSSVKRLSVLPLSEVTLRNPFWKAWCIYAASDTFGFLVSLLSGSHLHLDLIGTGSFALVSIPNFVTAATAAKTTASLSQKASSIAVSIWAVKLASFLFFRASQVGHDSRLTDTLSSISGTFGFWFITFLWNVCCSLPYLLGLLSTRSDRTMVQAGGCVFLIGLLLETTADIQKWIFKQSNPAGQFCNVGVWTISQHPNFFGNLVLWAGIFLMNLPALIVPPITTTLPTTGVAGKLQGFFARYHRVGLALLSPLFMGLLFYGQASGAMTNSTQLALGKYGHDPEYRKYIETVPLIFPRITFGGK